MNLTSRSRYALKIMLDLAASDRGSLVKRQDIVQRQGIPSKYLDQILVRLRRDGLVESCRGRHGGYQLGKEISSISVWEIFRAVEDGIYPVECVDEHSSCKFTLACVASEPWRIIFSGLRRSLQSLSLADLVKEFDDDKRKCPMAGIRECKPGREPLRQMLQV